MGLTPKINPFIPKANGPCVTEMVLSMANLLSTSKDNTRRPIFFIRLSGEEYSMPASLALTSRLGRWLDDHDCSVASFVTLTDGLISQTRLSQILSGTRPLYVEDEIRLESAFTDLKQFVQACDPMPLNFKKALELQHLFREYKAGRMTINIDVA
jgi:hypothetical protein